MLNRAERRRMEKAGNNGDHKEETSPVLMCPFWQKPCPEVCPSCKLNAELRQATTGGLQRTMVVCAFGAMMTILSELNMKTPPPQENIKIPQIYRG